ncbi:MAG: hypothetical protein IJS56_05670 [Bacilli bacterium]|nr:hypothetical protein [Bacilli bacterium]
MTDFELLKIFIKAVCNIYQNDSDLIKIGANERAITHRLGFYIEEELNNKEYNVDCEYNRDGFAPKKNNNGNCIIPDVIIHKRLIDKNYLVIEAKKDQNNNQEYDDTKEKLKVLTNQNGRYKYQLGIFIDFKKDIKDAIESIIYYKNGENYDLKNR